MILIKFLKGREDGLIKRDKSYINEKKVNFVWKVNILKLYLLIIRIRFDYLLILLLCNIVLEILVKYYILKFFKIINIRIERFLVM